MSIAETVQHFITTMDSLKLNMVAVDQIYPLLSDLVQALNRVRRAGACRAGQELQRLARCGATQGRAGRTEYVGAGGRVGRRQQRSCCCCRYASSGWGDAVSYAVSRERGAGRQGGQLCWPACSCPGPTGRRCLGCRPPWWASRRPRSG